MNCDCKCLCINCSLNYNLVKVIVYVMYDVRSVTWTFLNIYVRSMYKARKFHISEYFKFMFFFKQ